MLKSDLSFRFNLVYYSTLLGILAVILVTVQGREVYQLNSLHCIVLDVYFSGITSLGNALLFLPVLIVLLFIRFDYALMMTASGCIHGVVILICKRLLFPYAGRPVTSLDLNQLYFVPGIEVHQSMSFPSGHTATAFAFLVLLSLIFKSRLITVVFSLIALSVGLSRIYLLQHYGIDVLVGAIVGSVTSLITYYVIQTSPKPPWASGRFQFNHDGFKRRVAGLRQLFNW